MTSGSVFSTGPWGLILFSFSHCLGPSVNDQSWISACIVQIQKFSLVDFLMYKLRLCVCVDGGGVGTGGSSKPFDHRTKFPFFPLGYNNKSNIPISSYLSSLSCFPVCPKISRKMKEFCQTSTSTVVNVVCGTLPLISQMV